MTYTLDTALDELELSVRTANVLKNHGCLTLRDASDKIDMLKQHARGFGAKGYRELKELIMYASRMQGDMLEDTEYRRYVLEDRLRTAQGLIHDVEHGLILVALRGHTSDDIRRQLAFKLRDAAAYIEQLPTLTEI